MGRVIYRGEQVMAALESHVTAAQVASWRHGHAVATGEAPVRTGELRDSGVWFVFGWGGKVAGPATDKHGNRAPRLTTGRYEIRGGMAFLAPHTVYVVNGTRGRPGNPFMRRGFDAARLRFGQELSR